MMPIRATQLIQILRKTMTAVRAAGAEAFRSGDDELVREAQRVVHMLDELLGTETAEERGKGGSPSRAKRRAPSATKGQRGTTGRKYPKFVGDRGGLARIGWSKKEKREYRHRVTREVFDSAVQAMSAARTRTEVPVLAEQIVGRAIIDGEQVPAYQTYVVIGFLKHCGVINQLGRQGYEIPSDLEQIAQGAWDATTGGDIDGAA